MHHSANDRLMRNQSVIAMPRVFKITLRTSGPSSVRIFHLASISPPHRRGYFWHLPGDPSHAVIGEDQNQPRDDKRKDYAPDVMHSARDTTGIAGSIDSSTRPVA